MGADEPAYVNRPDQRPGPEAQAMASTLDERVQRALMGLRPNHRQCLLLSDLEDMSAQQIGEVMGLSYGAVRTLLCRARGEMRRALAADGFEMLLIQGARAFALWFGFEPDLAVMRGALEAAYR